jgi:hypothetical protein
MARDLMHRNIDESGRRFIQPRRAADMRLTHRLLTKW